MKGLEFTLQDRGIKPTAMRILVLEKLLMQQHAISHKELLTQFEKVDRVTLFRTLKTFLENKLIHSINDGTGVLKYALCESHCRCLPIDLHTHFHCIRCEQTFCLTDSQIPNVTVPKNFIIKSSNLVIKGFCDSCN